MQIQLENLLLSGASAILLMIQLRDALPSQIVCFFNIVQTAFDPPSFLNIYVADYIADYSPEVLKICNKIFWI